MDDSVTLSRPEYEALLTRIEEAEAVAAFAATRADAAPHLVDSIMVRY